MKTLDVKFTIENAETGEQLTGTVDVIINNSDEDAIQKVLEENKNETDPSDWEILTFDNNEIHADYQDLDRVFEYAEAYNDFCYDIDIFNAGIEAGINLSDIEEAYAGTFRSDEEFAEDMAEQTGAISRNAQWPYTCIDWEQAARELMYDYTEANGHYFRNF